MKELFGERSIARINYYKTLLESRGIPTIIKNEYLSEGLTEIPEPDVFPSLCVLDDEDYTKAVVVIREDLASNMKDANHQITCASCGEICPGNFENCWACGTPFK
jgi:Putative prokaryotic signal transducing protein